jgi:hypothetical protein
MAPHDITASGSAVPAIGKKARSLRGYFVGFALPSLLTACLAGFSLAVLYSNGEEIGPREAARIQHASGGLYGSALFYRPYPYKLELYRLTQPDVAIVGSSRALPFLQAGFSAPVVSLGGAVNEIADAERLIPEMLASHKPRLIIFTLDYWWFNAARVAEAPEVSTESATRFTLLDLVAPYQWLWEGDVRLGRLLQTMIAPDPTRIGVWANQSSAGFDVHGARHYGAVLSGGLRSDDVRFKRTLKRLRKASADSKMAASAEFSGIAWASLERVAAILHANGVEVRFVLPPIAGTVLQELRQTSGTGLLDELRARLTLAGYLFYDFTDPSLLGATDCEFVDGFHAGFVTYLRMLRQMAQDFERSETLRGIVKPAPDLDALVSENAGRATLRDEAWSGAEVDFLDLGCKK